MPNQDSPSAVRTGYLTVNPAWPAESGLRQDCISPFSAAFEGSAFKSRHLQLKGYLQAGREHGRKNIDISNGFSAVRLGLRGLKMP